MIEERFEMFNVTIARIWSSLQKIRADAMAPFGLKSSHFMCLFFLHHEDRALTAAELSELSALDKAAVSRVIADLERLGYITYEKPDEKRRYRAKIVLTESGQKLSVKMNSIVEEFIQNAGSGLTDEDRGIFYKSLLLIASNLEKYSE